MRKLMILAVVVALVGVMALGGKQARASMTLVVDDDGMASATDCNATTPAYPTISAAVAAASPGDTIKVCPGIYSEVVQVNKTLTLLGAQAGVDGRTRAVPVTSESVVGSGDGAFQILANKVVIDGFTIQGVTNDPSAPPFTGLGAGVWTNPGFSGTNGGHEIRNNIVQNNIVGIYLNNDGTFQATVERNLLQNNDALGPASGNGIYSDLGVVNALIDKNKFRGHSNASILLVGTPQSSLTISNNELVGGGTFASERIVLANTTMSSVTGNFANGLTRFTGTIRLFGGNGNIAIDGNTLLNGVIGIRVDDPFAIGPNSNVTGHFNCIQGNSVAGLEVDAGAHTGTLDAKNNWWGSSTGPTNAGNPGGTGDAVIAPDNNVAFIPFLTSPPGPPCPQLPTPGKVTGGGQIQGDPVFSPVGDLLSLPALVTSLSSPNSKATFGFVVKCCPAKGNLEYNDHDAGVRIKAQSINALFIGNGPCGSNTHAKFTGTASVIRSTGTTTEPFTVNVDDCGEPGTMDKFGITTTSYSNGPSTLIGGNIQIHK